MGDPGLSVLWCEEVALAQSTWPPMNDVVLMPGFSPPVVVTLTADWLVVDLRVAAKLGLAKRSVRIFEIPVTQIANVEVEGWSAERSEFGWRWTTGFLHGSTRVGATTGLTVQSAAGHAVLRLNGPPVAVKPRVEPLLRLLGMLESGGAPLPPPGAPLAAAPQPDLASQIAQLASLRDAGALTDDEFAAAKARLLT